MGSIPAAVAFSLLVGSVSVYCDRLRQKSWCPHSVSCVWQHVKYVRRQSWDPPRYSLVVDEDVRKPTKQKKNKEARKLTSEKSSGNRISHSTEPILRFPHTDFWPGLRVLNIGTILTLARLTSSLKIRCGLPGPFRPS